MFLPSWFSMVLLLGWLVGGALAGALVGRVSALALGLRRPGAAADAAAGAAAVLALIAAVLGATGLGTLVIANGATQGWRGALLDHLLLWAAAAVCAAVVGRKLVAAGRRPGARTGAGVAAP